MAFNKKNILNTYPIIFQAQRQLFCHVYCSSEVWYITAQMRRKTLKHGHHSQFLWMETARERNLEILGQSKWGREIKQGHRLRNARMT